MSSTFGFIGVGNMGGALAKAVSQAMPKEQIFLANRTAAKAEALAEALGCQAKSCEWVAANCTFIFLGVKPQMMRGLLSKLRPLLEARKDPFVLISMAAGVTMEQIRAMAGGEYPAIRVMPNTPVSVGGGMVLYDATDDLSYNEMEQFREAMKAAGALDRIPEKLMDAGSAVSGCGPAFACMFAEALADGGVACGLPRDKALTYAAQMMLGTAQLILQSGQHPGALKDAVCSPGGSTIRGVLELENSGFRGAVSRAVQKAYERTVELGK